MRLSPRENKPDDSLAAHRDETEEEDTVVWLASRIANSWGPFSGKSRREGHNLYGCVRFKIKKDRRKLQRGVTKMTGPCNLIKAQGVVGLATWESMEVQGADSATSTHGACPLSTSYIDLSTTCRMYVLCRMNDTKGQCGEYCLGKIQLGALRWLAPTSVICEKQICSVSNTTSIALEGMDFRHDQCGTVW